MSEFSLDNVLFLIINKAKENMLQDTKGNIFNIFKNSLQESLGLAPIYILTIPFRNLEIFKLWEELPQKINLYVITEWK
jgi:hypothetical protein